ncbi:C4-dicarboxylate ABC transporter, partial [Streptomyces beijiangensis]|nr:C4-dicarboxylate ABC transporter [Streptomyces beijiangensis]
MTTLVRTRPYAAAPAALRHLGPNWYATVMGTAIVATAGAALPVHIPGLPWVWALSAVLLLALLMARAG